MGHDITRGMLLEKRGVHSQDMRKDLLPDNPLQYAGKPDNHITPDKTETIDEEGDHEDQARKMQQRGIGRDPGRQTVHTPFQYPRNEQLQQIDGKKRETSGQNPQPILSEDGENKAQQPDRANGGRFFGLHPVGCGISLFHGKTGGRRTKEASTWKIYFL